MSGEVCQEEWTRYIQETPVRIIAVSPEKTLVAVAGGSTNGGWVQIRSARTGTILFSYGEHATAVCALAFSPVRGSSLIASASDDGSVRVWNVAGGETCCCYRGHTAGVDALAWSPTGTLLASGGRDRTVQVWDPFSGKYSYCFAEYTERVYDLAWMDNGHCLASASTGVVLHRLDTSGQMLERAPLPLSTFGEVMGLDFFPGCPLLALGGSFPHVEVWDTESGTLYDRFPCPGLLAHKIIMLAWGPDPNTRTLLTLEEGTGAYGCSLRLWQVGGSRASQRPVLDQVNGISAVSWIDRRTVVVGTSGGVLMVRHLYGIDE